MDQMFIILQFPHHKNVVIFATLVLIVSLGFFKEEIIIAISKEQKEKQLLSLIVLTESPLEMPNSIAVNQDHVSNLNKGNILHFKVVRMVVKLPAQKNTIAINNNAGRVHTDNFNPNPNAKIVVVAQ